LVSLILHHNIAIVFSIIFLELLLFLEPGLGESLFGGVVNPNATGAPALRKDDGGVYLLEGIFVLDMRGRLALI